MKFDAEHDEELIPDFPIQPPSCRNDPKSETAASNDTRPLSSSPPPKREARKDGK